MVVSVNRANMLQHRSKRARICFASLPAKGGEDVHVSAALILDPRKSTEVRFDPSRSVAGDAVLPASEPQKDKVKLIFSGATNESINQRKIKLSFLRLQQFPGNRREHSVQIEDLEFRPDGDHVVQMGRTRIMQFTSQNEKWFSVYDKSGSGSNFLDAG